MWGRDAGAGWRRYVHATTHATAVWRRDEVEEIGGSFRRLEHLVWTPRYPTPSTTEISWRGEDVCSIDACPRSAAGRPVAAQYVHWMYALRNRWGPALPSTSHLAPTLHEVTHTRGSRLCSYHLFPYSSLELATSRHVRSERRAAFTRTHAWLCLSSAKSRLLGQSHPPQPGITPSQDTRNSTELTLNHQKDLPRRVRTHKDAVLIING